MFRPHPKLTPEMAALPALCLHCDWRGRYGEAKFQDLELYDEEPGEPLILKNEPFCPKCGRGMSVHTIPMWAISEEIRKERTKMKIYGNYIPEKKLLDRLKRDKLEDAPRHKGWMRRFRYGERVWIVTLPDERQTYYRYRGDGRIASSSVPHEANDSTLIHEEV